MKHYPRNMLGYGQKPPHPEWPEKSRIALQFVLNYEEGGENCILPETLHPKRSFPK